MPWFSKRSGTLVPREVLGQLNAFGRASWDAKVSGRPVTDPRYDWTNFFSKILPAYQANPDQLIAEIHAAAGDDTFAKIGGYRVIADFEPGIKHPLYLEMMDACLQMMYDQGLASIHMTGYEKGRWIDTHGDIRTSFDRIIEVTPPRHHTANLALAPGDSLMVAKMGPHELDNQFWIERINNVTYGAFSMRQWDSDAVALTRCEEKEIGKYETADGVLRDLGIFLRLRPHWAHEELDPYFPERRVL